MEQIIHITNDISRAKKMRARIHNLEIAFTESREYQRVHPVPEEEIKKQKFIFIRCL